MNEAAQNAFLKTLEEPKDFCHFVLITEQPTALLPTILSRAQVFFLRTENPLDTAPAAKEKIMALAKRLVAASPKDLPEIALEITKSKTEPRATALAVTSTTIELLYKSYFKTGNQKFLTKLPGSSRYMKTCLKTAISSSISSPIYSSRTTLIRRKILTPVRLIRRVRIKHEPDRQILKIWI